MTKLLSIALTLILVLGLAGCKSFTGSPLQELTTLTLIDAARIGVTAELAPRIEQAYAQGKVDFATYTEMRDEEKAALDSLAGLRTKELSGQPVTQEELATAETTFIVPLQKLIDRYVPLALPATQPAR